MDTVWSHIMHFKWHTVEADPILPHTDISENVQYDQIIMWATWTRDVCTFSTAASIGTYFLGFFFLFSDTNLFFNVYIGSIDILKGRGGLRWAAVT